MKMFSFEYLIEKLNPERDLSRSPIFNVMFQADPEPEQIFSLAGLKTNGRMFKNKTAKFDLKMRARETGRGRIMLSCEYNSDIFLPETVRRFLRMMEILADSVCRHPEKRISALEIMDKQEKQKLLDAWNDTRQAYPKDKALSRLFENQAKKTPDNIAVQFEKQKLTYRELNERSNRLAHYLRSRGVKPNDIVAVATERNFDIAVTTLAVHKAGGCCLLIDTDYPDKRISHILKDAKAKIMLVSADRGQKRKYGFRGEMIDMNDSRKFRDMITDNPVSANAPGDLAYILYTSGSTGRPKGVMITHRGVVNHCLNRISIMEISADDRLPLSIPLAFVPVTAQFYAPLIAGAELIIYPKEIIRDPVSIFRRIDNDRASILLEISVSALKAYMDSGACLRLKTLRSVGVSGEKADSRTLDGFLFAYPRKTLFYAYGQTECGGMTLCHPISRRAYTKHLKSVTEGRPVGNVNAYVLDKNLKLLPLGLPGELYISGDGLARGYLNDPQKTKEVFLPHPFRKEERIYKTGDRARMHPDGNIEILGRIDHQINIRGLRVEPGEIEANLKKNGRIKDCVVVKHEETLAAYYTTVNEKPLKIEDLKDRLKTALPDYMIPAYFAHLKAFPLNRNGKLDRSALPAPAEAHLARHKYEAPRGTTEEKLSAIWKEVLGIRKISRYDNFFDLGGHSLRAISVLARINKEFSVDLPVKNIFLHPVLSELAANINAQKKIIPAVITPAPKRNYYPLTYAQKRMWVLYKLEPRSPFYNISQIRNMSGSPDISVLGKALRMLVRRHASFRTNFAEISGNPVQLVHPFDKKKADSILTYIDIETSDIKQPEEIIKRQIQTAFNFEIGPLCRFTLIKIAPDKHVFVIVMHHIISDAWSMNILYRELAEIYNALRQNRKTVLPPLSVQYKDYAVWEQSPENEKETRSSREILDK